MIIEEIDKIYNLIHKQYIIKMVIMKLYIDNNNNNNNNNNN